MKTTKRFFIALLAFFSVIAGKAQVIPVGEQDFAEENIGYCFWSDTEVYVVNYSGSVLTTKKVVIPEIVTKNDIDYTVVGIFDEAFQKYTQLEEVVLPPTVEEIGAGAFTRWSQTDGGGHYSGLSKLAAINLDNVKRIGANAFRGASALKSITLSSTMEEIGANAFDGAGLISITLPSTLTNVGSAAFANCISLEMLKLETSAIAANVFSGCENLVRVEFGTAVKEISDGLFANTGIAEVDLPLTLACIGARAFKGTEIKTITIPASVTEIKALAFDGCSNLLNVNFESSPKISDTAFPSTASLNLTIKDKEAFSDANGNTFSNITYERTFTSDKFATLILPFEPDQFDQLEVYKMRELNGNSLIFDAVEKFEPGTPYMVRVKEEFGAISELTGTKVVPSKNGNTVKAGDWKMIGQYERIELNAEECAGKNIRNYYYKSEGNQFLYSEGTLGVSPFRAYIQAPIESAAQVRMMIRSNDGVETEIDAAELEDVFAPADDIYYDMNGCRVFAPVKGRMYIVNGKKVIF